MNLLVNFIVSELLEPFSDKNIKRTSEISLSDIFYLLNNENPINFHENSLVKVRVQSVWKANVVCKVISNKIFGSIYAADFYDDKHMNSSEINNEIHEGQEFLARVKSIDFKTSRVNFTIRPSDLLAKKYPLKSLITNWSFIENTFRISFNFYF